FPALAAARRPPLVGVAAQEPQLRVVHVRGQRLVDRLLVDEVLLDARPVLDRVELYRPQLDAAALARAGRRGAGTRLPDRGAGGRGVFEAGVRPAEPEVGHRETRIGAQRLVERAGRLDPDVRMKIRDALVVESLGVLGGSGDGIVEGT